MAAWERGGVVGDLQTELSVLERVWGVLWPVFSVVIWPVLYLVGRTLIRHNEEIAVLKSGQAEIKALIADVKKGQEKQTETCQAVLMAGGHVGRGGRER